jgi:hypothetical protein
VRSSAREVLGQLLADGHRDAAWRAAADLHAMDVNISQTHSAVLTVNISQYQLESYLSVVTPYHSVTNLVLNLLCAILPFSKN